MRELLQAIRSATQDRRLDTYEVDSLLRTANEGGFEAAELREILRAFDATDHGLTPELRARLRARLGSMRATSALDALMQQTPRWTAPQRLAEERTYLQHLIEEAKNARQQLGYFEWTMERLCDPAALAQGRLEIKPGADYREFYKLQSDLSRAQQTAVDAMTRLSAHMGGMTDEARQAAFASMAGNGRYDLQTIGEAIKPAYLIGATEEQRAALAAPLPATGLAKPSEPTSQFAGVTFAAPTTWEFDNASGVLKLPAGTQIASWPVGSDFSIEGQSVRLPSGHVLESGRARIKDGVVTLARGAQVSVDGVSLRSRDDQAQVRSSRGVIITGPGIDVNMPEVGTDGRPVGSAPLGEAELAPQSSGERPLRFTAQETTLPNGVEVRRGTGRTTVITTDGKPVGVLQGSTVLDPGALTYRRAKREGADLVDRSGERGRITSGSAVYRDDELVGFTGNTSGTIDGIKLETDYGVDMTSYKLLGPGRHEVGPGTTVRQVPTDRAVELTGERFNVRLDQDVVVTRGGVRVENGRIVAVLPGSQVRFPAGTITTDAGQTVSLLSAWPEELPSGNAVFMGKTSIAATGRGFTVSGGGSESLLPSGNDDAFGNRPIRSAMRLDGGSLRVRTASEPMKPNGLEVYDVRGDVTVQSGPQSFRSTRRRGEADAPGQGGPMTWVQMVGERFEMDARPMFSTFDPKTDSGQTTQVRDVKSERFGGALAAQTRRILAGERGASPELVRNVQETLSYFMDRRVEATGTLDEATVTSLKLLQRMMGLEQSGELDARTMRALDEVAPPVGHPTTLRSEGRFGPPVSGQVGQLVSGQTPPLRYRGRGTQMISGELIARVQQTLNDAGHHAGNDGMFGPGTEGALRAFQSAKGLPQTGQIDGPTMRAIVAASPSTTTTTMQPRPKYMVMIAMNDEVPDELRRFRELAASRGATPIIMGIPDTRYPDASALTEFLGRAERGEIDLDWLVASGHSTGTSTWGKHGRFEYSSLQTWAKQFPRAFAQIEKLSLLNCYNVTPEKARDYWPTIFPNLQAAAGFMYSAPGKESQASDEFLLNSGVLMAQLGKGETPSGSEVDTLGRRFTNDSVILHQNAGFWLRTQGSREGQLALTNTARREMMKKGAEQQMRTIPQELKDAYDNYFKAETDQFADPPSGHTSQLRDYLGAVQHVLDGWEGRIARYRRWQEERERFMAPHQARREQDPSYRMPDYPTPEEFSYASGWERSFQEVTELRAKVLSLIKHKNIRQQFGVLYPETINAFNAWLSDEYARKFQGARNPVLFPTPDELPHLNRRQVVERLRQVQESLGEVDYSRRRQELDSPEWSIMRERAPTDRVQASPEMFMQRAVAFLRDLNPSFIQPEWLDDNLLERDRRRR